MNAPTLLVGLGGTGCKIIERVSQMLTPEEQETIAFAAFDTDINELRGIQERNPFVKTIQTSTRQTVGEYLNQDVHARDSWFPVNAILNKKVLSEGAGQVRSISRLAFETVIKAGKLEPLHEAIQSLYKVEEDKVDQAMRVIIVSSLAGGTGSGLILPVALYINNYLSTHFRQNANITRGFFILPEVFYDVIVGQAERNNLKANAYATLRELDAFLMKGDATLPERYTDFVKMEFPRVASAGFEEYNVRPYDFCFLFDAQNAEGSKLNSFDQYLEHAANCIYAQSIGPMNKRSNSSEDNTIRKLAKERGRNRYAGAGASMLIYPYEDIRTFIALNWAKQCISDKWLEYDRLYKKLLQENARRQEMGLGFSEQSLDQFYVKQIEAAAKHEDPFASAIFRFSGRYKNGVTREGDRWIDYNTAVLAKIESDLTETGSELEAKRSENRMLMTNLAESNEWSQYSDAYYSLKEYNQISQVYAKEVARTIGYSMFKGSHNSQDDKLDYKLEYHLKDNHGNFFPPNAIRYTLIKARDLMRKQKEEIERERRDLNGYFENFEENTFDDKDTEDVIETADDLNTRKKSLLERFSKKPTADQEEIYEKLSQYFKKSDLYREIIVKDQVLSDGISYLNELIKSVETFFQSFEIKIDTIDKRISQIKKKYTSTKGTTVRYVCGSKKCLEKIYEKKPYKGSSISIDSDLAKQIYDSIWTYSQMEDKPATNRFFSKLFDDGIIGYFEDTVTKEYGEELDIDVLDALEKEAEYEGLYNDVDDADRLYQQYVVRTINDTRKLSCPFIETPLGETRDPINACAFNKDLKPVKGDDSPKAQLIRKELMNFGGEADEDISKHMIMFYQSYYGLRANDLSKFAPPEVSETYNRSSGEYYKAYYELVTGINPICQKSKEISPHIDKWWHLACKMPDLDDGNQAKEEHKIYAAFFWAMLNGYIYRIQETNMMVYKLRNLRLGLDSDILTVSNGTECDKLYEVLDAVAIYPELVEKILADVQERINDDINENSKLENGLLARALKTFRIEEPGIGPDEEAAYSIFDYPMLMKKSSTPDIYYEPNMIELLKAEIDEVERYLRAYCNPKELPIELERVLRDQFDKHLISLQKEAQVNRNLYRESLTGKTFDTMIATFKKMGLKKLAEHVDMSASQLQ